LVVAKAYIDQLERSQGLSNDQVGALRDAIQKAESSKKLGGLKKMAASVEKSGGEAKNGADAARLQSLANVLKNPAL
jgi:hypothetical protein